MEKKVYILHINGGLACVALTFVNTHALTLNLLNAAIKMRT